MMYCKFTNDFGNELPLKYCEINKFLTGKISIKIKNCLLKNNLRILISNFSKFTEYITDSVRPVQQKSRSLLGIINEINFFLSIYYYL